MYIPRASPVSIAAKLSPELLSRWEGTLMQFHHYVPLMVSREMGGMCTLQIWRGYITKRGATRRKFFQSIFNWHYVFLALLLFRFHFLVRYFCLPDIMAEKMKQEALFWTEKKLFGRIKAMSQWNMLSARLQTTVLDMIPSGRMGAWRGSGDCWTAFGRSRPFYYCTDLKHNPFRVACSEQACCANSSRMNSSNHHLPWNLAHAHLLHS